MFPASCHCGNIKIEAQKPPATLTRCNCSICDRLGALWAYFDSDEVEVTSVDRAAAVYAWGEKTIEFFHCPVCACCTHYRSQLEDGRQLLAINARMTPAEIRQDIRVRDFDGAVSWRYLDRPPRKNKDES